MMNVEVQGLKELERKLISMGPKVSLKAMRSALVSGAQVVKRDVIERAPVRSGRLKRSVLVKRMTKTNPFNERVIVGVRHGKKQRKADRDAFYWTWMEFGFKDRAGRPVAPQKFIRPAFEAKKGNALNKIIDVLKKKISQYAKERA